MASESSESLTNCVDIFRIPMDRMSNDGGSHAGIASMQSGSGSKVARNSSHVAGTLQSVSPKAAWARLS